MNTKVEKGDSLEYIKNKSIILKVINTKNDCAFCYFKNVSIPNNTRGRVVCIKYEYLKYFNKIG